MIRGEAPPPPVDDTLPCTSWNGDPGMEDLDPLIKGLVDPIDPSRHLYTSLSLSSSLSPSLPLLRPLHGLRILKEYGILHEVYIY